MTDSALGAFDSRYAMRHERTYPHPIDLVWEAVTTAEHLNAWMLPQCEVDARIGGKCSFTWGDTSPDAHRDEMTIIEFDPPRVVDYGGIRFELEAIDRGTRLVFIQTMPPDPEQGDQWIPDFCAGFHTMLDRIPEFLDGTWTRADNIAELASFPEGPENYRRLIKRYESEVFTLRPAR
ncbi:MAG TPA: SRPBCC domain-containing protein [Acidimicrobiales bacterium]|nr:SRPBCC domain-containing protein [Acidimicrobiales bacterium]